MWSINELIKTPKVTYVPGVPEIIDPGQPYKPAYCVWTTRQVVGPGGCEAIYNPYLYPTYDGSGNLIGYTGGYEYLCYGGGTTTEAVQVCYPAQPYIAPVVIQEGIDDQFITDYLLGWNGGAVGGVDVPDIGVFSFYIYGSAQGAAVGFADRFSADYQGYAEMELSVIATNGFFGVRHNGVIVTSRRAYTSTTEFRFEKNGQKVDVLAGGDVLYQCVLTESLYRADCSLYAAYDGITDATMTEYATEELLLAATAAGYLQADTASSAQMSGYREQQGALSADTGSSAGVGVFLMGGTLYSSLEADTTSDASMIGSKGYIASLSAETLSDAAMGGRRRHEATLEFEPMTLLAGTGSYAVSDMEFEPLTIEAGAGQITPSYAIVAMQFAGLTLSAHCLTGEVVTSTNLEFEPLTLFSSDHAYAAAELELEALTLVAFESIELDMSLFAIAPGFKMVGTMLKTASNGLIARSPGFSLQAETGSQLSSKSPGFALSGGMTIDGYMTLQEAIGYA